MFFSSLKIIQHSKKEYLNYLHMLLVCNLLAKSKNPLVDTNGHSLKIAFFLKMNVAKPIYKLLQQLLEC